MRIQRLSDLIVMTVRTSMPKAIAWCGVLCSALKRGNLPTANFPRRNVTRNIVRIECGSCKRSHAI